MMARNANKAQAVTAVKGSDKVAEVAPNAPAVVDDNQKLAEAEVKSVQVTAVFNYMRNPYTGAGFKKGKPTDVIDLESKDNSWTRAQIKAGVLKIV